MRQLLQEFRICSNLNSSRSSSALQHPARDRVELLQQLRVARLRRGDQGTVEGAVRADRARLVLALLVALGVLTFVPEITLWLPNLLLPEPGRAGVR